MNRNRTLGFALAALIFIADQAVKAFVVEGLGIAYPGAVREILPFFDLRFVANNGVSLGLLAAETELMRWGLVVMTAVIAIGVGFWMAREKNRGDLLALAFVLGGALGNIVDRTRFGYVVDYADLHFGEWRPFLVFNVADAAITIGVVILLIRALFVREKPKAEGTGAKAAPVENANA
ncbi:signal peptidase II [Sphingomonas koreensis]|uniref:signal peptidase II n=1 Tax=Sphingomonas koreensis TaxID=93064 RepID=UPI000835590E|nr:signal peptidase II [Sphingomonas koreensis]PJI89377.1 signal peptidase II [Sphingomonas koreensis]RSU59204.1 signal peptidase II [Sphingomonas koreensis]RSU68244.1 signal peptidase II [Sphingomonas koreensis]